MPTKSTKPATNNLRAWREFRRLSQDQLAELIGTKGNVIGHLESGERGLSDKWLRRLAPALGTSPGFLLDHAPEDLDAAYIDAAMSVSPDQRAQVLEILKTFRKVG
jgi:transcriptional regulator with XRE-family HTH domain